MDQVWWKRVNKELSMQFGFFVHSFFLNHKQWNSCDSRVLKLNKFGGDMMKKISRFQCMYLHATLNNNAL